MSNLSQEFLDRAKLHWTPEREAKVTGGKSWPVKPSEAAGLLRVLGLLSGDSSMPADSVRKFSQINHMVTLLLPQLEDLTSRHDVVRILDACCGTSYLTLLVGWLINKKWGKTCHIIGIDANPKVISTSQKRAEDLGLSESVKFVAARVDTVNWEELYQKSFPDAVRPAVTADAAQPAATTDAARPAATADSARTAATADSARTAATTDAAQPAANAEADSTETAKRLRPHLLVSLHACDTATDHAIGLGVKLKADALAVAPCCQAELARKWQDLAATSDPTHPFGPVFRTPHFRREIAAQMTDVMRMLLVRSKGYEVTATEFVSADHTPKNRLLSCTRRGNFHTESAAQYAAMKNALAGQGILLEELLSGG